MTFLAFHLVGFVASKASLATPSQLLCPSTITPTSTSVSAVSNLAALYQGSGQLADYSASAISFFSSIRIPAALIAGSSLATVFSNAEAFQDAETKESSGRGDAWQNRLEVWYRACALLAFLLSLNVVFTATATSTALLLGMKDPMARSAYELLRREVDFEFTSTRWSFFAALLSFVAAVAARMCAEFHLFQRGRRWRSAGGLLLAHLSLWLHLLSVANRSLLSWPHVGSMTLDLLRLLMKQARHYPLESASAVSAVGAAVMCVWAGFATGGFARWGLRADSTEDKGTSAEPCLDNSSV
jgi:hypothetical protein